MTAPGGAPAGAVPGGPAAGVPAAGVPAAAGRPPLLTVTGLRTDLVTGQGFVHAVDGVSLTIRESEVVGLVGESGCGKSVTCRTIVGLLPPRLARVSGEVIYHPLGPGSILGARGSRLRSLRGAHLAMIPQDPMTALNPVLTIGDQVAEAVTAHAKMPRGEARERAAGLLRRVGIPAPEERMRDYPFQFSGGMLQRVLIAIALASSPRLLLADEPTTSLDVIIQDQILSLLVGLQRSTGMSMLLISHDLAVVAEVCDRIAVMYAGQIVEEGETATIITRPRHPYTQALLSALPGQGTGGELRAIPGQPPSLVSVPAGCRFRPRCRLATDDCRSWATELLDTGTSGHRARCWRHAEAADTEVTWLTTEPA